MAFEQFYAVYQCYSTAFLSDRERHDVENGGKILLPQDALEELIEQVILTFKEEKEKRLICFFFY